MAAKTDHALERLVFFSDAVFAIAITLLVLEIEVPHLPRHSGTSVFLAELDRLIPSLFGYLISFTVIGLFWVSHHRAFAVAERYVSRILPWNLGLLGMIALMPWFTALMSSNIRSQTPWLLYCGALTVTALLNLRVVRLATGDSMASEAGRQSEDARYIRQRSLLTAVGAAAAFFVCLFLRDYYQFALIAIVIVRRGATLVARLRTRKASAA